MKYLIGVDPQSKLPKVVVTQDETGKFVVLELQGLEEVAGGGHVPG